MKKYIFGILAVAMAIGFSAFTSEKATKPVNTQTYFYTASQKLISSLSSTDLASSLKWNQSDPSYTYVTAGNSLAAITFDMDQLTKQEAISGVSAYYVSNSSFPNDGLTIGVVKGAQTYDVTIRRFQQ